MTTAMEFDSGFIPTRVSAVKKVDSFESVSFVSHKAKSKRVNPLDETDSSDKLKINDMKKLRYEIIKFGTSGLNPTAKEASSVALAVALGAKPPKRKYKNYKEILAAKSSEKSSDIVSLKNTMEPNIHQSKQHYFVVGQKVIPSKPKNSAGSCKKLLDHYGKVGGPQKRRGGKSKGRNRQ